MVSSDWLKVFEEPEACAEGGTGAISVFQMRRTLSRMEDSMGGAGCELEAGLWFPGARRIGVIKGTQQIARN